MKLVVEAEGFEIDAWLRDFVETSVVFAIWHHELQVETVLFRLDRATNEEAEPYVRCAIRVETQRGPISSGATGAGVCEATREAANLLEVALYGPFFERAARRSGLPLGVGRRAKERIASRKRVRDDELRDPALECSEWWSTRPVAARTRFEYLEAK